VTETFPLCTCLETYGQVYELGGFCLRCRGFFLCDAEKTRRLDVQTKFYIPDPALIEQLATELQVEP
jgi:hypothetical protein